MEEYCTMTGIGAVIFLLLGLSQNAPGALTSSSPIQQLLQKPQNSALRNGYAGYPAQGYVPVKGIQIPYSGTPVYYPQTLQYQGYSVAPSPQPAALVTAPVERSPLSLACPTCPSPVPAPQCPAPAPPCPLPVAPPTCPAPVVVPPCPASVCPAPVPAPICSAPAPPCTQPAPPPACPAPVVAPPCPAPVPAPACPVAVPATPAPTPPVTTCVEDTFVADTKKRILDIGNWKCAIETDAAGVTRTCVVTGTSTSSSAPAPGTHCDWIMPQFCDPTVNQLAATMAVTPPTPPPPPSDYVLVDNQGYVKLHKEEKTFKEAVAICASEGTTLAIPLTPADYPPLTAIFLAALPTAANGFYVGFTDEVRDDLFDIAATGQPMCMAGTIEFQSIYFSIANENCTVLGFRKKDLMQDIPCTWKVPFMCQQQLPSRYKLAPCV